ncbi:anti-anti-sigma factor [Saccharopolyspora erythraea NRRL 2338]|uniref:Anti-sigma factor antagonist n=2 Tax=Saccharopolyspora erythraea TaxID=1836 RepID=A4FPF0_SACEN|nr:STAS domain-containing protein [Saccharopolyspora erythraea]PFG99565.1 anti-anti-sigma factor [Saccharopolyspora erythraea NRRL 2338]QRK89463.1 STAS domain-containing protein [Saccharopolyspora erythraea]CAM05925.1 hypothetical protein SACE_6759 [Saccharopolyspora erythraea NRRL 2338]
MLANTPGTPQSETTRAPTGGVSGPTAGLPLRLRLDFTDPELAVLSASGELDALTTPALADLLWPRLMSKLSAIVVDLSGLRFLGVAGLELLVAANRYAQHRGIAFGVVNNTRTVDRALAAGGLDRTLVCYDSASEARAAVLTDGSGTSEAFVPQSRRAPVD